MTIESAEKECKLLSHTTKHSKDFAIVIKSGLSVDMRCATCRRKRSLRTGTFFREFPRIPLGKLVVLMYLWSHRELRSTVARMLSLTRNTVGNVYAVMRHYCGRDLEDQPVTPFGGRVFVVKSDESQFRHKSK
ncbi:hypothetical protein pdam_00022482, partial [Pocillopora damicornis]